MSTTALTVGVIGAGRVGAALGAALHRRGHRVVAVAASSGESRARVRRLLPDAEPRPIHQVPAGVDLLLIAVPDDALAGLIGTLAAAGTVRSGQLVAHTSGAHGRAILAPLTTETAADGAAETAAETAADPTAGVRTLALHPAMTFTGADHDVDRLLAGTAFGVTAPPELAPLVEGLVNDLGGTVEWIAEDRRALYHAALSHGANHLVTLVNEAADRLRDAGVRQPAAVLAPLLTAALDNVLRLGDAALTGPVSRGDAGTVAAHLAVLAGVAPESVPPYLVLARRTADRAIAAGRLTATDAKPLLDVLAGSAAAG